MPLSTQQLQALSDAVAASGVAQQNVVTVVGSIPVEQPPAPPPPPPPPAPPPPPPGPGTTLYFAADGNNANPGTEASPKRDMNGVNHNALPAGSSLRFRRGDVWTVSLKTLENMNTTKESPLVFEDYGAGDRPEFQIASGNMFHLGGGWENQSDDKGYTFRNLKLNGMGTAGWCFWFAHTIRDVVIDNCEITGFAIGLNSNDTNHGVRDITIRGCQIHHNRSMGLLGHWSNFLLEWNHIYANNFSGSTFDHGTYIGGGSNITIRGNHYDRNSVVNGVCTGGNMTFHGQIDGLLIEGNTITQDASEAWLMSITHGYTSPEWFRNTVVRGNTLINSGNTAIAIQSAPGVLVEDNIIINRQGTNQTAIFIGSPPSTKGDDADGNAIVRNNRIIRANGSSGNPVSFLNAPGSVEMNNTVELE